MRSPPVHDDAGRSGIGGPLHRGLAFRTTCSGDTQLPCRGAIHRELVVVAPDTGGTFAFHPAPTPATCPRTTKRGCHKSTTSPLSSPLERCEWDTLMGNRASKRGQHPMSGQLPEGPKLNSFGRRHSMEQTQDDATEHQATPDSPSSSPPCLGCASCLSPDQTRRSSNQRQRRHSCCPVYQSTSAQDADTNPQEVHV